MQWSEIRQRYPAQWLLLEALDARSASGQRVVEQMQVVAAFPDGGAAWRAYGQRHRETPEREFFVYHSARETIDIKEQTEPLGRGLRQRA